MLATSKLDVVVAEVDELVDVIAMPSYLMNCLFTFFFNANIWPVKYIFTFFKRLFYWVCLLLCLAN
jgi:hypothetical protein